MIHMKIKLKIWKEIWVKDKFILNEKFSYYIILTIQIEQTMIYKRVDFFYRRVSLLYSWKESGVYDNFIKFHFKMILFNI